MADKANGNLTRWIMIGLACASVLIGAGRSTQVLLTHSREIKEIKEVKCETRFVAHEKNYEYIVKELTEIKVMIKEIEK